jgi:hypothetical protein
VLHATRGGARGHTSRKMKQRFLHYKLHNLKEIETMKYMEVITHLQRTPHKSEIIRDFNFISTVGLQNYAWSVTSNYRKRRNILRAHGVYQLLLFGFPKESSRHESLKPLFVQRKRKYTFHL